jgi:phosphohistidine swiveling domain-containing protein
LITVQPWGIEACLDDTYKISTFLRKRLQEIGKTREFEEYKGLLSVNTGETVAFTEKKNLYQVASKLIEHPAVRELFQHDVAHISAELEKYETENALFEKHAHKYEWVNTEYVSGGWTREQWLESFKKVIHADVPPHKKLEELVKSFEQLNNQRQAAIKTLNPPPDVAHAIDALGEFIAQRDWTKGYFTRSLLSYNKLLDEIARRLLVTRIDLLSYSYLELSKAIQSGTPIPQEEVESRKTNGFAFTIKDGEFRLVTGAENIRALIESEGEGISEPFEKLINISEFKGTPASAGHITAKARVIEDASMISELEEGEILVTYMTTIEFIPAFKRAAAVITDEGGMSCHAAIISREFRIPCVVGTKIATRVIQTGDTLEVDAARGTIKILK